MVDSGVGGDSGVVVIVGWLTMGWLAIEWLAMEW